MVDEFLTSIEEDEARENQSFDESIDCDNDDDEEFDHYAFDPKAY